MPCPPESISGPSWQQFRSGQDCLLEPALACPTKDSRVGLLPSPEWCPWSPHLRSPLNFTSLICKIRRIIPHPRAAERISRSPTKKHFAFFSEVQCKCCCLMSYTSRYNYVGSSKEAGPVGNAGDRISTTAVSSSRLTPGCGGTNPISSCQMAASPAHSIDGEREYFVPALVMRLLAILPRGFGGVTVFVCFLQRKARVSQRRLFLMGLWVLTVDFCHDSARDRGWPPRLSVAPGVHTEQAIFLGWWDLAT